jgi:hypothetical protein
LILGHDVDAAPGNGEDIGDSISRRFSVGPAERIGQNAADVLVVEALEPRLWGFPLATIAHLL